MKTHFSLILLVIPFSLLGAGTEVNSNLFNNLTDNMSSIAQTAKDQRANIDYLPYIMTVFDGEELAHAGASSLKEALSLAAGVNIASDNLSLFNPVFRGSNPVAYGQSKLIVDGIEVNDLFFDGYTAYLSMPIDMIKRIEIVRGPGSYSDGHSGYAGSIVVTTYKGEVPAEGVGHWFVSTGTSGTKKAGVTYATKHDDFSFAADLYTIHDNLSLTYGQDGLSNGILSYDTLDINNRLLSRSGDAPVATDATMASASLSKGAFFADGRISTYRHGSGGGINYALASEGDHYNIDQWQIRAGTHYNINTFSGTVQATIIQDSFTSHQLLGPIDLQLPKPITYIPAVTFYDGFYGIHEAFIRTYRINNTLSGNLYGGDATFGISGAWSNVSSEKTITTDRDSGTGLTDYSISNPFFNPNGSINNQTAYITYERPISTNLIGYASLTLDHRNGLATQIDPRLAAVYTLDPNNLLKFSISRAHRNPSWQEMFTQNNGARWGNPELLPETVMAYETQYIHKFETEHTLSFNLFRLNNDDQIYLQNYKYVNGSKSLIQGIEGEWRKRYDTTTFYAAYTHIWAEDGNGITLPNTPADTARGFITQTLDENWYASLAGRWQNKIPRASTDTRNEMKSIGIVDTSIGYKLPTLNSEIQFTIKNIFDEKELYPSPSGTYNDDYPSTGRAFMAIIRGTF